MKFLKTTGVLMFLLFIVHPNTSFAAGSATFVSPPSVTFQQVSGGYQPVVSGQIAVQAAIEEDFVLGVAIYQSATAPTQDQIDFPDALNQISTTSSGGGYTFNASAQYTLNPGTAYQFLFKIVPADGSDITGDTEVVAATTPGVLPDGGGTNNPPCAGCPVAPTSIDSGSYPGWPTEVIDNPLQVDNLNNFVAGLLNAFLKIGIPVLVLFLVYSGLRLVMARGNEKELEDAKKNLLWVIIGGAILLGAWTIVKILKGTFDQIDIAMMESVMRTFI